MRGRSESLDEEGVEATRAGGEDSLCEAGRLRRRDKDVCGGGRERVGTNMRVELNLECGVGRV